MRTLPEALAMQSRSATNTKSLQRATRTLEDLHDRYADLANEALADKTFKYMMGVWEDIASEHGVPSGLMTAFMAGLIAGIEMEKHE